MKTVLWIIFSVIAGIVILGGTLGFLYSNSDAVKRREAQIADSLSRQIQFANLVTNEGKGRRDYYVYVKNFSGKKQDFEAIEKYCAGYDDAIPFSVHLLDTAKFDLPANGGLYGGEGVRRKVIAQYNAGLGIQFDPFAYHLYEKPE